MQMKILGLTAAACLVAATAGAGTAQAAVSYSGSDGAGLSFTFTAADFITTFDDEACSSTVVNVSRVGVHLYSGASTSATDGVVFHTGGVIARFYALSLKHCSPTFARAGWPRLRNNHCN